MSTVPNIIKLAMIMLFVALAAGCSMSNIEPDEITSNVQIVKHHQGSVSVKVVGGEEKEDQLRLTNASVKEAVEAAIKKSKLFSGISNGKSDYRVDVIINSVNQPAFGFTMTVTVEASWIVTRLSDNKLIWRKAISSSRTLGVSDEAGGLARVRRATGEAAGLNIEKAFAEISKLNL